MTEVSWRGYWWVPGEDDQALPGTLYCADDGRTRLELIGGFDTEIRTPLPTGNGYTIGPDSRHFPLIHGQSGRDLFTLIDTLPNHTSGIGFGRGTTVRQDLLPARVLHRIHLRTLDEPIFIRGHLQLDRLLQWSSQSSLDLEPSRPIGEGTVDRSVSRHAVAPLEARYKDMTIRLRVRSTEFNVIDKPIANRRSIETEEWATLDFEPNVPVSFDALDLLMKDMQDLLTLSFYVPCASHSRSLIFMTSDDHPDSFDECEADVWGRQTYQSVRGDKDPPHLVSLFTLGNMPFAELVPRWLELKSQAPLGFNVLFGLRYISTGYVGSRLLAVATAAESIHRGLCSTSTPLPRHEYGALKKKLLEAVAMESGEVQDFVRRGLRNDPSYRDRLLELARIPDDEAVDLLLSDRAEWATRLKNARHDLAHANERSSADADSTAARWLLEVSYALLCLVAMAKLGLSPELQRRALQHPKIQFASHRFHQMLKGFE